MQKSFLNSGSCFASMEMDELFFINGGSGNSSTTVNISNQSNRNISVEFGDWGNTGKMSYTVTYSSNSSSSSGGGGK
ncbi:MAG: hypothetical protein MSS56_06370 [Spirochaetia bacterium]|nr:hypothetical protein [Spirochaetia bacterium]